MRLNPEQSLEGISERWFLAISLLFLADRLPLYCLVIVRSSAGGTETIHVVLDVVETELADLKGGFC